MAARESEEIKKCLKPIILFSWVFSVPRMTVKFSYRIIHGVISVAIYLATFSVTFDTRLDVVNSFNTAIVITYIFTQLITFSTGIGTILFWIAKGAKALDNAIIKLSEIDVELKDLGMKIERRKIVRRQIGLILLFFNLWLMIGIINECVLNSLEAHKNMSIFQAFSLAYSSDGPHLPVLFGELMFSTIMHIFYLRFQWINQILKELSKDQEYLHVRRNLCIISTRNGRNLSNSRIDSTESLLLKIKRLYQAHQRLCEIMENISSSFSWQLYMAVSVIFSLTIYRLFVIYSFIFLPLEESGVRIALQVVWMIYYLLKFSIITFACINTSAEANRMGIVLHGVEINDKRYHRMLQEYSVQLCQKKVHFTAGAFFHIDQSIVSSFISHVTTYIIFAVDVWTESEEKHSESTTPRM